jgi:hypothetical protein
MHSFILSRNLQYLKSYAPAEGGLGIVHFSDIETSIGFELFRSQVPAVVRRGVDFATFSVMSKSIMARFLNELGFEIVVITNDVVPRDAVAVFRRKRSIAESSG